MGRVAWAPLTSVQRGLLEALPVPDPRRDEVVSSMLAARRAMLTAGRETAERCGVTWPGQLDTAVAAYYARELGAPTSRVSSEDSSSALSTSATTRIASPGG